MSSNIKILLACGALMLVVGVIAYYTEIKGGDPGYTIGWLLRAGIVIFAGWKLGQKYISRKKPSNVLSAQ